MTNITPDAVIRELNEHYAGRVAGTVVRKGNSRWEAVDGEQEGAAMRSMISTELVDAVEQLPGIVSADDGHRSVIVEQHRGVTTVCAHLDPQAATFLSAAIDSPDCHIGTVLHALHES